MFAAQLSTQLKDSTHVSVFSICQAPHCMLCLVIIELCSLETSDHVAGCRGKVVGVPMMIKAI